MVEDIEISVPTPHYVMLPPHTDNPDEPIRYDCSLCDLDVYNISMHSQFDHGVRNFTVDNKEHERKQQSVEHRCGINGCSLDGNHDGPHSWESSAPVTSDITASAAPALGGSDDHADHSD